MQRNLAPTKQENDEHLHIVTKMIKMLQKKRELGVTVTLPMRHVIYKLN